jgi:8-oxo-dGTP pyrophosphatase MutT (NUDIX family)
MNFHNTQCCSLYVSNRNIFKHNRFKKKTKKAGMFIVDRNTRRVLLIQSRGKLWGFPKGSLNIGESYKDGAIREVYEETGLVIDNSEFGDIAYKPVAKTMYFFIYKDECPVSIDYGPRDNDATGIGWIHLECLERLFISNIIHLTSPCLKVLRIYSGLKF